MKEDAVVFLGMGFPMGITRFLAYQGVECSKALGDRGFTDFYFAAIDNQRDMASWEILKGQIQEAKILRERDFNALKERIERLFSDYNRVLVHTGGGWGLIKRFRILKKKYGERFVHVVTTHSYKHDYPVRKYVMSFFQNILYRLYADKVVFQCPFAASNFFGGRGLLSLPLGVVVPLGCESFDGEFQPSQSLPDAPWFSMLEDSDVVNFVYLAEFRPGKMHLWMLKALLPLFKSHSNLRLYLFGRCETEVGHQVVKWVREHGLERQVVCAGRIDRRDVPYVLKRMQCAIVPSRAETFGHNYIEPMVAGIPVIGTRTGAGEYAIQDYVTGFGISLSDERRVLSAVEYFLRNPSECKKMGENAKRLAQSLFLHQMAGEAHARLYLDLLR